MTVTFDSLAPRMNEFARTAGELAELAEPAFGEFRTTAYIIDRLAASMLSPAASDGQTGCFGTIDAGRKTTIALRADIDALPNADGDGHAHLCGHNAHAAMLLHALDILNGMKDTLPVNIRYIFQPAEEKVAGAASMIGRGCLDGVSSIFGIHVAPDLPVGRIGVRGGPVMAGSNHFRITVEGEPTHAAYPHKGTDTVAAAAEFVMLMQKAVSRLIDPVKGGLVSFGAIHGGHAANILPGAVTLDGTFRHFDPDVKDTIVDALTHAGEAVEGFYGVRVNVHVHDGTGPVVNDRKAAGGLLTTLNEANMDVETEHPRSMGGEDFAVYLETVPGAFIWLGAAASPEHPPLHATDFFVPDEALVHGVHVWTVIALGAGGLGEG